MATTEFARDVKKRLLDLNQSHDWLIGQVSERTGLYFDRSYLSKILRGKLKTPKILDAIQEILWPERGKENPYGTENHA